MASGARTSARGGEDPVGMHVAVLAGGGAPKRLGVARRAPQVLAPERLGPGGIDVQRAALQGHRERRQGGRRAGEQFDLPAPVLAQLFPAVGDADEAGLGKDRRRAVAQLVVEFAADDDDQIRLLHRPAAHGAHHRGVVGRDQAAAFLRVEIDGAGRVEEAHQLLARSHGAAAGDDQRAFGGGHDRGGTLDIGGVGWDTPWWSSGGDTRPGPDWGEPFPAARRAGSRRRRDPAWCHRPRPR